MRDRFSLGYLLTPEVGGATGIPNLLSSSFPVPLSYFNVCVCVRCHSSSPLKHFYLSNHINNGSGKFLDY